jgi:phosphoglycolate phosphatase-like HAD superfamily hydrolase/predicted amidophosphoribosyltransferase
MLRTGARRISRGLHSTSRIIRLPGSNVSVFLTSTPGSSSVPHTPAPGRALDALLIDLDNTLCATDHLRTVRRSGDLAGLRPHLARLKPYGDIGDSLRQLAGRIPLGIVSRTHRWYVEAVIERLFPDIPWRAVVTYDDVQRQKPYPDGLELAWDEMGLQDGARVAYLGDARSDMEAAYHANMLAVLARWGDSQLLRSAEWMVPDAVLRDPGELLDYASKPDNYLPILEARIAKQPGGSRRVLTENTDRGAQFSIDVLGRYFGNKGPTLHLHERHLLSRWLQRKDEPERFLQRRFVEAVSEAVAEVIAEHHINLVTVIPGKPGRTPRMEQLLGAVAEQLNGAVGAGVQFVPDLLAFAPDATTIKFLGQQKRREEVARTLRLVGRCAGRRVLVMDDVVTSGASLGTARSLLVRGRALYVRGLAIAKTISWFSFEKDPTVRACPACGRRLVVKPGKYGRFWGCEGWRDPVNQCDYSENY